MSTTLTIDFDSLTLERAERLGRFLCVFSKYMNGDFDEDEEPAPVRDEGRVILDPAAAFGPASQQGNVSADGPHLVIQVPPAAQVPPPPPNFINVPAAPSTPVITIGAVTDKSGLPWDARIHASSKGVNADGTWRLKRGVDKNIIDSISAELRKLMAIPNAGPQLVPPPPPPVASNVPPPPAGTATLPEAELRQKYVELVGRASAAAGQGKVSPDQINRCLSTLGVENMPSLSHRLDLVPAACNLIDAIIAGLSA